MFFLKKRIRKGICMLLAGMLLAVCCAAAPAGSAVAADASVLPMYRRAVDFPAGDLSRLAQVIRRAQCGEPITIGFLGGSITEGHGADNIQDCYVSQVYKWWCGAFPQAEITVVNAGIGGTSSYLGVHRVDTELLVHQPDLVFIEFAVNDTFTEFCMNSYENLIRKVLMADSSPALVLLFAANADGNSSQSVEAALGQYYELPMISYGNAVIPEVAAGSFLWHEIAEDTVHPNNMGHSIFASLITTFLEDVCARIDQITVRPERLQGYELPNPVTPQIYQDAHIENAATITPLAMTGYGIYDFNYHFTDNWYSMEDGSFLSFSVEASNIGVIYQRTVEGTFGQYDMYVDGVYVKTLDGNYVEFYGTETEAEALYASPDGSTAAHVVTIVRNPQSANVDFVLIGLLLS